MASTDFVYGTARAALNSGLINLTTAVVDAMLVSSAYSPQPNVDQYVSSNPSSAIIVRDVTLTGTGLSASGAFFGTIPQFSSLISAMTCVALILYIKTGSDSSSQLLYYTSGGVGFPFQPLGYNYSVSYDQNSGGFFQ